MTSGLGISACSRSSSTPGKSAAIAGTRPARRPEARTQSPRPVAGGARRAHAIGASLHTEGRGMTDPDRASSSVARSGDGNILVENLRDYRSPHPGHYDEAAEPDRSLDADRDPCEIVRLSRTKVRSRSSVARP